MNVLNAKQRLALQLIAQGWGRTKVANHLQVDPATLSRWRRLPEFSAELERMIVQGERECIQTLQALRAVAVDRLSTLIDSAQPSVALKAVEIALGRREPQSPMPAQRNSADVSNALFDAALDDLRASLN